VINDVAYRVARWGGSNPRVHGMRVGRWAVRMKREDDAFLFWRPGRMFIVDHINTGTNAGDFDSFDEAIRFADDISRYSERDCSTRDVSRIEAQLGRSVVAWLCACRTVAKHIPYREWLAARRQAA
jgi:hypothetical protein